MTQTAGEPAAPRPPRTPLSGPAPTDAVLARLTEVPAAGLAAGDQRQDERLLGDAGDVIEATGALLHHCALELPGITSVDVDHARLVDCRLANPEAASLRCVESVWRAVRLVGGRLGPLLAAESHWEGVVLEAVRVGYLDLRQATVADVILDGCRIDTLDLTGATATRLAVRDCVVGELLVSHAVLVDVDLRNSRIAEVDDAAGLAGSTIGPDQLLDLAPSLARALGVRVSAPEPPAGR